MAYFITQSMSIYRLQKISDSFVLRLLEEIFIEIKRDQARFALRKLVSYNLAFTVECLRKVLNSVVIRQLLGLLLFLWKETV